MASSPQQIQEEGSNGQKAKKQSLYSYGGALRFLETHLRVGASDRIQRPFLSAFTQNLRQTRQRETEDRQTDNYKRGKRSRRRRRL
jgi:hypothetical protein